MDKPETELIRVFIATAISSEAQQKLAAVQTEMKRLPCHIGWVAPQNIHLTLVFLGDIFPEQIEVVKAVLESAAATALECSGEIHGLGSFGSPRHPRVIWAGLTGHLEPLLEVQAQLATDLKAQGFYLDDRPFTPHLTLGRLRAAKGAAELEEVLGRYRETRFGGFIVNRLLLMRSQLTAHGPEYSTLHQVAFPPPPATERES